MELQLPKTDFIVQNYDPEPMHDGWRLDRHNGVHITHIPTGTVRECGVYNTTHENGVSAWASMNAALEALLMKPIVGSVIVNGTVSPTIVSVGLVQTTIDQACSVSIGESITYAYVSESAEFDIEAVAKQFNEGIIISRATWAKVLKMAQSTVQARPVKE